LFVSIASTFLKRMEGVVFEQLHAGAKELDLSVREGNDEEGIGHDGAKALAEEILRNSYQIEHLNLNGSAIGPEGCNAVLSALIQSQTAIKSLGLARSKIGDGLGAAAVASLLQTSTSLRFLDLEDNELGPKGVADIALALKNNQNLENLALGGNSSGEYGAKALAEMLETNTTLTGLMMSLDDFRKEETHRKEFFFRGAQALLPTIAANSTLRSFFVSVMKIEIDFANLLVDCLERNHGLTQFGIGFGTVIPEVAKLIVQALGKSATVEVFNFGTSNVEDAGFWSILETLQQNTTVRQLRVFFSEPPNARVRRGLLFCCISMFNLETFDGFPQFESFQLRNLRLKQEFIPIERILSNKKMPPNVINLILSLAWGDFHATNFENDGMEEESNLRWALVRDTFERVSKCLRD